MCVCVLAVCWSCLFTFTGNGETDSVNCTYILLAAALKDGHVALWTVSCPAAESMYVLLCSSIVLCLNTQAKYGSLITEVCK